MNNIAEKNNVKIKSHLLVATHNEISIRLAVEQMKHYSMEPNGEEISFGQIYGMADYLSTPLGKKKVLIFFGNFVESQVRKLLDNIIVFEDATGNNSF